MLDKQFQPEQARGAQQIQQTEVQGDYSAILAMLNAQKEALKGQMQITNIRIVDALNFLVRPTVTYFFVILYALAKVAMFAIAMRSGLTGWDSIMRIYDHEDRAILSGLLAY